VCGVAIVSRPEVLAAPELVVTQPLQTADEIEVTAELQLAPVHPVQKSRERLNRHMRDGPSHSYSDPGHYPSCLGGRGIGINEMNLRPWNGPRPQTAEATILLRETDIVIAPATTARRRIACRQPR
jgi:hypothetical protein